MPHYQNRDSPGAAFSSANHRTHPPNLQESKVRSNVFEGRLPGEPISYKAAWRRLCQDIKRPDLNMHDMRHAAAANLLRAVVTLGVAAQVLGHDPAVLARRYGHLETETLRRAQEQAWELMHEG